MTFFPAKRSIYLILLFSILFVASIFAKAPVIEQANLYTQIAKENLKSLTDIALDQKSDVLNALISDEKEFYEVLYEKQKEMLNPHEQTKRRAIFNLLCQKNLISTEVLDEKTWQDLEILCGPKSDPKIYLASKIDRTYTQMGKAILFSKIVNPSYNIKQLENQQQIIKELVNNTDLFDYLDKQLKDLAMPEHAMLSFWEEDTFKAVRHDDGIKMPFLTKKMNSKLNKNSIALEVYDLLDYSQIGTSTILEIASAIILPLYAGSRFLKNNKFVTAKNWLGTGSMAAFFSNFGAFFFLMKIVDTIRHRDLIRQPGKYVDAGGTLLSGVVAGFFAARLPKRLKYMAAIRKCLQERLIYVSTYINNIKSMIAKVKSNSVIHERIPAIEACVKKLVELAQTTADVQHLLALLETKTFKSNVSIWSNAGRIFAAFNLMHQQKEQFVDAMLAVGELDAQLSIAKLYKEFQNKHITMCFPDYIDPVLVDAPSVRAIDFWNPFIDPEKVVPSSLEVGQIYQKPQNIIITGPNAGGKSTITKAFVMAIILAQSLGIAPASELTITPFKKIITYLNITDDIAAGNSHFKAGVLRAQDVENTYKSCKEHEYALTAIDEVFNGTTFKEGQAAAYSLISLLGNNQLGMCITNTHFPLIPTLAETTNRFMNYKVTVLEEEGQKIKYPFKLEPGISDQVVTLKILKEQGFSGKFLDTAQQVLNGNVN